MTPKSQGPDREVVVTYLFVSVDSEGKAHFRSQLLLTVPEAANIMRISPEMIYTLMRRGELPSIHIGRSRRISAESLRLWIEDQEQQETSRLEELRARYSPQQYARQPMQGRALQKPATKGRKKR
jgi:excisionase family DNA binding protein